MTFVRTGLSNIGDSGLIRKVFDGSVAIFLVANLVIRFSSIFYYPPYNGYLALILGCVVAGCAYAVIFQKYLKVFLFIFGFSFFLFGFSSIEIQSRIFELIVTCVALTLFVSNWKEGRSVRLNRPLVILILCYIGLSLFSLLLLPVRHIFKDLWFFGFPDAFFYLFIGPGSGVYYSVAAVIRLMLFVVMALALSGTSLCHENYKTLFSGIFSGAIFCIF